MAKSYEESGVNLEAGYEVVSRIKKHVASTNIAGCMGNIGAFGGMFDLGSLNYKHPILVSGTDGVGTKLKIAFALDKHDTIGIDAVAMCVNDVLAQGAKPLVFLDYVAVGKNHPAVSRPSLQAWLRDAVRQDVPSWAARPPRCPACMPKTTTTSRDSPSEPWRKTV